MTEPKIKVSGVPMKTTQAVSFTAKNTRERVIAALESDGKLPDASKAQILARIEALPAVHELIAVDYHEHAHAGGVNCSFTIRPVV